MITKAKKKNTGRFKHRVDLMHTVESDDGQGGTTTSEEVLAQIWVKIRPVSGSQKLHLDAIESNVSHVIEMRYRDDIDLSNENWIEYNGRTFNLHYILNQDEESAYMEIAATEG